MLSDWGLSNQDMGSFPDDEPLTRAQLIRCWWHNYLWVLRQGNTAPGILDNLNKMTKECEERGIVVQGRPMPRTGSEDLADQCDEAKKRIYYCV